MEEIKKIVPVEQSQELPDEELEQVAGGVGSTASGTIVDFTFEYTMHDSRYQIRDFIKKELRKYGVPESVVSKVPVMSPEKPYMSYGAGAMRVVWQQGWPEPKFYKTHD